MLLFSEDALLNAVSTKLLASGYVNEKELGIEYDEMTPNLIGQKYIAICPSTWSKGPEHDGGSVYDHLLSIVVHVIVRVQDIPKDRLKTKFRAGLGTVNTLCAQVNSIIDFKYDVLNEANAEILLLESDTDSRTQGFIEPLKFQSLSAPKAVPSSFFSGGNAQPVSGLCRSFQFYNARRVVRRYS